MYLILFLIVFITGTNQVFGKVFSQHYSGNMPSMFLFGVVWTTGGSIVYLISSIVSGQLPQANAGVILLAIAGAVCFVFCNFFLYQAMASGPLSVCIMFATGAVAIPCLLGPLVFSESIDLKRGIALLFLFSALFLVVYEKEEKKIKCSLKFVVLASMVFLLNGASMFVQKYQPFRYPETTVVQFSFFMFGFAALMNAGMYGFFRLKGRERKKIHFRTFIFPCLVTGVSICTANQLSMIVSKSIDAAVQYPIQSGGLMVVTTLYSALVLREKVTLRKWIGICMVIVSIIFL